MQASHVMASGGFRAKLGPIRPCAPRSLPGERTMKSRSARSLTARDTRLNPSPLRPRGQPSRLEIASKLRQAKPEPMLIEKAITKPTSRRSGRRVVLQQLPIPSDPLQVRVRARHQLASSLYLQCLRRLRLPNALHATEPPARPRAVPTRFLGKVKNGADAKMRVPACVEPARLEFVQSVVAARRAKADIAE